MKPVVVDDCRKCAACCKFMILPTSEVETLRSFKARRPVDLQLDLKYLNPHFPARILLHTFKQMVEHPHQGFVAFACELLRSQGEFQICSEYENRPQVCRSYPCEDVSELDCDANPIFAAPHCYFRKFCEDCVVVSSVDEAMVLNEQRFLDDDSETLLDLPSILRGDFLPLIIDVLDEMFVRAPVQILVTELYRKKVPYKVPRRTGLKVASFLLEHGIPLQFFYQTIVNLHPYRRYAFFPPPHVAFSKRTFDLILQKWLEISGGAIWAL